MYQRQSLAEAYELLALPRSKAATCAKKRKKKKKAGKPKPDEDGGSVTAESEAPDAAAEVAAEEAGSPHAQDIAPADQTGPSVRGPHSNADGSGAVIKAEQPSSGKAERPPAKGKAGKKTEVDERAKAPTENGHHRASEAEGEHKDDGAMQFICSLPTVQDSRSRWPACLANRAPCRE